MRHSYFRFLIVAVACLLIAPAAHAAPITVSTGDLGLNVVEHAGRFETFLNASTPWHSPWSNILVKYGLWNSPDVSVSVFFNGTPVGSFLADMGYVSPGPSFAPFDVTGLLQNGPNTITFDGFGASYGDYIVGQVDLTYDDGAGSASAVPEPASMFLLGSGLFGALAMKRRAARK